MTKAKRVDWKAVAAGRAAQIVQWERGCTEKDILIHQQTDRLGDMVKLCDDQRAEITALKHENNRLRSLMLAVEVLVSANGEE